MKREVVEDFLNLPGIAGVALMDRRSRPYFCGVDNTLNFQQKEALAQGIRQVVETTPEGFESFEFQFTGHQVYIYKLAQGMILLVLTGEELIYSNYLPAVDKLKAALEENIATAIATFRLLAGSITLSSQSYWKSVQTGTATRSEPEIQPSPAPPPSSPVNDSQNGSKSIAESSPPTATKSPAATPVSSKIGSPSTSSSQVTLKEILAALNHLSKFTTQYLGTAVITNYWKSSCPDIEWLRQFQVTRTAEITLASSPSQETSLLESLSPQQIEWIQTWVAAFINRCARVIRDFPLLVEQTALNAQQKKLLLP